MKKIAIISMTVVLAVLLAGCSATFINDTGGRDGSNFQKAVIVGSARAEHIYVDRTWPGASIMTQIVAENEGRPYHIVTISTKEGTEKKVYFDISRFYRKKIYPADLQ